MFPGFRVNITNLLSNAKYNISLDFINTDNHRYKFQDGEWIIAGRGEAQSRYNIYQYPGGPRCGKEIMKKAVVFNKVKLSNSSNKIENGKVK